MMWLGQPVVMLQDKTKRHKDYNNKVVQNGRHSPPLALCLLHTDIDRLLADCFIRCRLCNKFDAAVGCKKFNAP